MIEPMQVEKLEKPPLILALARVMFAPLPLKTFEDVITELHSVIRSDYPGKEEIKSQGVEFAINASGDTENPEVQHKKVEDSSFIFSNSDSSWAILVSPVSLTICTKKYLSFEDLSERVLHILGIFERNNVITHTSNISLRYINRIDIDENSGFEKTITKGFLQPRINGFKGMGGSDMVSFYQSEQSWCFLRTSLKIEGFDIPNELLVIAHKMKLGKEPVGNVFASIDIESNTMSHDFQEFDLASIKDIENCLVELHGSVKKAFGSVLTDSELKSRS